MSNAEQAQRVVIPPPPEAAYDSHDAAESALHEWTRAHGFNVSRRRVRYTDDPDRHIWARNYECDRAGAPKNTQHIIEDNRRRVMRGSKRSACPMRIGIRAVSKQDISGPWKIVHTARSDHHNHPPSRDIRAHAAHRRRSAKASTQAPVANMLGLVELQTAAGVTASTIQATLLNADPNSLVVAKDISNTKDAVRRRELASRTAIEALFEELKENNFFYKVLINPDTNEVTHLIWAHPETTELFKLHHDILVADCTYKTNKHRIPLLNIIVVTGANTVLPVAQCWLPGEKEEDFVWAFNMLRLMMLEHDISCPRVIISDRDLACLKSLDRVFPDTPSMVCRWHMIKNVESMTRKHLGQVEVENPAPGQPKMENSWQTNAFMATFFKALNAETEEEFEISRLELAQKSKTVSDYLDLHWWKYKSRIAKHCTNKYTHFGVRDTSTVEGTHAKVKSKLKTSRGDLYTVFKKLLPWWTAAAGETRFVMAQNATIAPHILQKNRYTRVVRIITRFALKETEALWRDAEKIVSGNILRSACSGVFRAVHGRPCLHELISIIESNGQRHLAPEDFDKHWWIYRDQEGIAPTRIQDPATLIQNRNNGSARRRRLRNHGASGTGREPTLPERIDANDAATPPSFTSPAPSNPQIYGSQEGDSTVNFQQHFIPPRAWSYAGRYPFSDSTNQS